MHRQCISPGTITAQKLQEAEFLDEQKVWARLSCGAKGTNHPNSTVGKSKIKNMGIISDSAGQMMAD
jgi:hypothetical protein